jgi:hypothetical protein
MSANNTPAAPAYQLTREDWLLRAVDTFRPLIKQITGVDLPPVHVSIGFGGTTYEKGVRGVCWHTSTSADERNHIFISPEITDTAEVLATLLHELFHATLNNEDGHRGRFAEYMTRAGFLSPFTAAVPDISLTGELMVIAAELGEFPHAGLTVPSRKRTAVPTPAPVGGGVSSAPKPQTNRYFVVECPHHGGPVRMSRKRIAQGIPLCGIGDPETGAVCTERMVEK